MSLTTPSGLFYLLRFLYLREPRNLGISEKFDGSLTNESEELLSMTDEEESSCTDDDEDCEFWAGLEPSECDVNPGFMNVSCRKACKICK